MQPAMEVSQVLHMNGGKGEMSYYKNSLYQKVILTVKPILEQSIAELCERSLPDCLKMVEMGCSSGPNALLPIWEIIETTDSTYTRLNRKPPTLQVFLNDLPENDFNTIFRSLISNFEQKLEKEKGSKFGPCFIAAMPGSFYGRLFPSHSLQFVHSSYSLHWCSQVPKGLVSESGIPLNKGNICIAKTSSPSVHKEYRDQFERDFTKFLRLRSEEMVPEGRMVLTLLGKSNKNLFCKYGCEIWELIGITLNEMVLEGLIEESTLDFFNIPLYAPSLGEIRSLIEREGSFTIARLEEFELCWDSNIEDGNNKMVFDKWERGKYVANYMRAVAESMLASQFGDELMDDLFHRLSFKLADYLEMGTGLFNNLVISVTVK